MDKNERPINPDEEKEEKQKKNFVSRFVKKVVDGVKDVAEIFIKNPMLIIPAVSCIFGMVTNAKNSNNEQFKRRLIEDDVTGEKLLAKHPLTNDEIIELGDRMVDGQRKAEALNSMELLQKERKRK